MTNLMVNLSSSFLKQKDIHFNAENLKHALEMIQLEKIFTNFYLKCGH